MNAQLIMLSTLSPWTSECLRRAAFVPIVEALREPVTNQVVIGLTWLSRTVSKSSIRSSIRAVEQRKLGQRTIALDLELAIQVVECTLQRFFDHRMVERHT